MSASRAIGYGSAVAIGAIGISAACNENGHVGQSALITLAGLFTIPRMMAAGYNMLVSPPGKISTSEEKMHNHSEVSEGICAATIGVLFPLILGVWGYKYLYPGSTPTSVQH
jgi:hypothetical protein